MPPSGGFHFGAPPPSYHPQTYAPPPPTFPQFAPQWIDSISFANPDPRALSLQTPVYNNLFTSSYGNILPTYEPLNPAFPPYSPVHYAPPSPSTFFISKKKKTQHHIFFLVYSPPHPSSNSAPCFKCGQVNYTI